MANPDVAIPIVFPDYAIAVDTPEVSVKVPDLLPGVNILPDKLRVPATQQKVSHLGHAGILFIQGQTGLTRYYEYGRYPPGNLGRVRKRVISNVKIGHNGRPTRKSLAKTLSEISILSGHGGRISAAYIEVPAGSFIRMQASATAREAKNTDPKRAPYALMSNSCLHFMKETAEAGGARMPPVIAPHPAGYIFQVQLQQSDLDYSVTGETTAQDIELE